MMSENPPDGRSKGLGPKLVTEDSFAALVRAYMLSPKFLGYSAGTQDTWGRELRFAARPDTLGAKSRYELRPALVQAYLDALAGRPGKQAVARAALIQLERWAIVRDLLPRQIMLGVETARPQGGHLPWTDADVELGERCARPDLARVITLAANTGQRGSDLIRMGPTDVETFQGIDGINVLQRKTGRQVWVPITSPLAQAMATWERRPGPFLRRPDGAPWGRKGLTMAWDWQRKHSEALGALDERGLVLHGLRGTACVRLRQAGATMLQIADMIGMSGRMVERYCRFSSQRENAVAAVIHLERTLSERKINMSK
jgi:integrase